MGRRIVTKKLEVSSSPPSVDGYFDKLIKYIPSEIVGSWIAIKGLIIGDSNLPINTLLWILLIIFTALTAVYIFKQTSEPRTSTAKTQILISTAAFIVWAFALGEPFSSLSFYRPVYGSLLLILYNLTIPLINPPEGNK